MHHPPGDQCPAAPAAVQLFTPNRIYAAFLDAHQQGCSRGQPLLTEAGLLYAQEMIGLAGRGLAAQPNPRPPSESQSRPRWDAERRHLWLGEWLLKEFRQPAPNQTTILDVFEEQGWTAHIDDPLPPQEAEEDQDSKRRLHDTIKNLNRSLPPGTIRFRGDGTGQGVIWEPSPF